MRDYGLTGPVRDMRDSGLTGPVRDMRDYGLTGSVRDMRDSDLDRVQTGDCTGADTATVCTCRASHIIQWDQDSGDKAEVIILCCEQQFN